MAVAAAQKNREMFAIKKSYSIEVSIFDMFFRGRCGKSEWGKPVEKWCCWGAAVALLRTFTTLEVPGHVFT